MIAAFANKTTHAHIFGKASCTNHHLRNFAEHVVTISCQPKVLGMFPGLGKIRNFEAKLCKFQEWQESVTTSADSELANESITRLAMGRIHRSYRRCGDHASAVSSMRAWGRALRARRPSTLSLSSRRRRSGRRGESGRPSPARSQRTANYQHGNYEFRTILQLLRGSMPTRLP
jgi:hypothetical protein